MTTTTTILPPPVAQEFSEKMLSTPMPRLVHSLFAIPRTIDGNMGKTLRMRRYNRLQTVPVPVDPLFMNPPAQQLTAIDIDATVNWYSTYIIITREVTAINEDKHCVLDKLTLINSEIFTKDNEAEGQGHRERLNEIAA